MAPCSAALAITRAQVERVEDGRPVLPPDTFTPGETVHFSFHVEGFTRKENAVKLRFEAHPQDPLGTALVAPIAGEENASLSVEDKDWQPKLRGSFTLPSIMSGGKCRILLTVADEQSSESASHESTFEVSGPFVEPRTSLGISDLRFYRTEEDERPLDVAAFRVAEEVHARFAVAGFRHDERGATDVSYGISIADASGRVLFEEPAAARDQAQDFYPKPFVPGVVSFHLQPGSPPGEYVLYIDATDRIGDQHARMQSRFRLE